ncbi:SufE family protein [Vibrio methylphosphonaticus]|uniref:SufE family protein n=1 Tax=Vibrio methylphosphonaticus TaxID=2946866 RepID=UPI002029E0A6|nr:SufE family protein [Vibrio methylphosphonaticus]MCL9773180.1 SufE family protein [Vibrio methylphosphonaticus]
MTDNQPFGTEITASDIVSTMTGLHGWEARYRQVVKWGKLLPVLDAEAKKDQVLVSGCESSVWLHMTEEAGVWHIDADSDARIVRGLIAIVLAAYHNKTAQQILAFDIDGYFDQLNLVNHLSPSRGNGLKAIVETVKATVIQ